ncbi:hypothetical protein PL373_06705 [Tenacibaculum maritimum]|nr:hypothetical protein [Tenacibaculum maritimum]MDB0600834.1 hypothetical protein [Tenacibaculum maritimum]MDB0612043.1 hypothetical protein [Tenacibaculum maritimum]
MITLSPLGPHKDWRYVINPHDGNVLDIRHVVVIGYGENIGNLVEHTQFAVQLVTTNTSVNIDEIATFEKN